MGTKSIYRTTTDKMIKKKNDEKLQTLQITMFIRSISTGFTPNCVGTNACSKLFKQPFLP